jgi:hypothetical protein
MTPREAEQLLGGYATGTLTGAEREALFAAALEDQELFDALADEEALRELLADPGARAHLLAALAAPARTPVLPFWRRPGAMTLAASLLVAVGVGLLLRHGPAPQVAVLPEPRPAEAKPKVVSPAQVVEAPPPQAPPPEAPKRRALAKAPPRAEAAPAPAPAPAPVAAEADMAPGASHLSGAENQAASQPARKKAEAKRVAEPPPGQAGGAVASGLADSIGVVVDAPKRLAPPVWSLEAAPAGTFKLKVSWNPAGHLYLLRREASTVSVLSPAATSTSGGMNESLFTGSLAQGGVLDLYLLPEAAPAPASLPAEGPLPGFRARISAAGEKAP